MLVCWYYVIQTQDFNNYLTSFLLPDIKSFLHGEIIEILLSMIPTVWVNSMVATGLEPREKSYENLSEYLVYLESSLPDEPIPKKSESKDASTYTTSILKKDI